MRLCMAAWGGGWGGEGKRQYVIFTVSTADKRTINHSFLHL